MAETLSTRVKRLENAMAELDAQIKTEAGFQETGERIDKLVSAIGEFSRRNGKQT
jgi:hypothetical protein